MATNLIVCQSCQEALQEDGELAAHLTATEIQELARDIGNEVADHLCERMELGVRCDCAC